MKWWEIASGLVTLAVAVLAYLLAAAVIDHWVLPQGLGLGGRILLWGGLLIGCGWYFGRHVLPLLLHPINPVFAAYTIEQSRPSFKTPSSIFSFSAVSRIGSNATIWPSGSLKALRCGRRQSCRTRRSTAVDRSRVIRLGYVLAILVGLCLVYAMVSPKSPMASFRRVIWPWSDVAAPTRASITSVKPGDTTAYQGDTLTVSAEVHGIKPDEPVTLYYTTDDGQDVDQAIPMTVPEKEYRYQCELPAGKIGLQQGLEYYLVAGDFVTQRFRVEVQIPPTISVESITCEYPEYTGLAPRTVKHQGDIRGAIEGTRATIRATANEEIKRAFIEFDADPRHRVPMTVKGTSAVGRLTLKMKDDHTEPEHSIYQLRFTDVQKRDDRQPIPYHIDMIPDLKPEVHFVDLPPIKVKLPVNGNLALKVHAEDPDFGLRRVAVCAERENKSLPIRPLLNVPRPQKAHKGPFEQAYPFEPAKLGLKVGDHVNCWAEAFDNKEDERGPAPNHAETEKLSITIVAEQQQPPQGPQKGHGQAQNGPQDPNSRQNPDRAPQDEENAKAKGQETDGQGEPPRNSRRNRRMTAEAQSRRMRPKGNKIRIRQTRTTRGSRSRSRGKQPVKAGNPGLATKPANNSPRRSRAGDPRTKRGKRRAPINNPTGPVARRARANRRRTRRGRRLVNTGALATSSKTRASPTSSRNRSIRKPSPATQSRNRLRISNTRNRNGDLHRALRRERRNNNRRRSRENRIRESRNTEKSSRPRKTAPTRALRRATVPKSGTQAKRRRLSKARGGEDGVNQPKPGEKKGPGQKGQKENDSGGGKPATDASASAPTNTPAMNKRAGSKPAGEPKPGEKTGSGQKKNDSGEGETGYGRLGWRRPTRQR